MLFDSIQNSPTHQSITKPIQFTCSLGKNSGIRWDYSCVSNISLEAFIELQLKIFQRGSYLIFFDPTRLLKIWPNLVRKSTFSVSFSLFWSQFGSRTRFIFIPVLTLYCAPNVSLSESELCTIFDHCYL